MTEPETTPEVDLSQLTLIMLTYERQPYALRGMAYWAKLGVTLHVIDGSSSPIDTALLSGLGENIHYNHQPVGIIERIRKAIPLVQTPYASFISDDEFFLRSGIISAITALREDPELVACGGQCMKFWLAEENQILSTKVYPLSQGWAQLDNSAEVRIIRHFGRYTPALFYSVTRAEIFLGAVELITEREFGAISVPELQWELYFLWAGKAKLLDRIFWLRSGENNPTRGTDLCLEPEPTIHDWWRSVESRSEVESYVSLTAKHMAKCSGSVEYADKVIRQATDAFTMSVDRRSAPETYTMKRIARGLSFRAKRLLGLVRPSRVPMMGLLDYYEPEVADAAREDLLRLNELLVTWRKTHS